MQRLYGMFPARGSGVGLLLLRSSVAAGLVLMPDGHPDAWVTAAAAIGATALLVGLLTPFAAGASAIVASLAFVMSGYHHGQLMLAADAVAVLLLGPGAYSIDARRFGRRVLE